MIAKALLTAWMLIWAPIDIICCVVLQVVFNLFVLVRTINALWEMED